MAPLELLATNLLLQRPNVGPRAFPGEREQAANDLVWGDLEEARAHRAGRLDRSRARSHPARHRTAGDHFVLASLQAWFSSHIRLHGFVLDSHLIF